MSVNHRMKMSASSARTKLFLDEAKRVFFARIGASRLLYDVRKRQLSGVERHTHVLRETNRFVSIK